MPEQQAENTGTETKPKSNIEQQQWQEITKNICVISKSWLVQKIADNLDVLVTALESEGEQEGWTDYQVELDQHEKALEPLSQNGEDLEGLKDILDGLNQEFQKNIKGQAEMINSLFMALILNEHVLLEGLPGVGKTEIVKWIANVTGLPFTRIQFIPDMLPTDLIGKEQIDVEKLGKNEPGAVRWVSGPIFSSLVLADEVNRAPSKVQAALLEAMGEKQVTPFGKNSRPVFSPLHQAALEVWPEKFNELSPGNEGEISGLLGLPPIKTDRRDLVQFTVFATMNPIEQEGTYPLSEAQTDRFCFKTLVPYPKRDHYNDILSVVYTGEKPPDAAETDTPLDVCKRYFKAYPKHMIPVLLPLYFLLKCRSRIQPVKIDGKLISARQIMWENTEVGLENNEDQDPRLRSESEKLERIHDVVLMTNARRKMLGEAEAGSGWYDREQIDLIKYIQVLKDRLSELNGDEKEKQDRRIKKLEKLLNAEHCRYIKAGASPRGFLKLATAAACRAMIEGRDKIDDSDIRTVVHHVLRHRIHMDVHARLAGVTPDDVIDSVCQVILDDDVTG